MKNNNTREHILRQSMTVVREKGFKNTGLSEILKSAEVPKGSFYYYFDSKTDFGIELLGYAARSFFAEIESHFNSDRPPLERIKRLFRAQIDYYSSSPCRCNCLFGKLSQELTDEDPLLREKLKDIFLYWKDLLCTTLAEAVEKGEIAPLHSPHALAGFFLSGWEGALMQSKILQSVEPLEEFRDIFLAYVEKK